MRRFLLLVALCGGGILVASATPSRVERLPQVAGDQATLFGSFDHASHQTALAQADLECTSCHDFTGESLSPPPGACHHCHRDGPPSTWGEGEHWQQPGPCDRCHVEVAPPSGHGAGWIRAHGVEARASALSCDSCHRANFCVECHEKKEATRFRVHDRSWLSIHSVAARTDPTTCGTCHLQADCVACHATADGRLP